MKIVDYLLIESTDSIDFQTQMNKAIVKGYEPYGTLNIVGTIDTNKLKSNYGLFYSQAMIKYEEPISEDENLKDYYVLKKAYCFSCVDRKQHKFYFKTRICCACDRSFFRDGFKYENN